MYKIVYKDSYIIVLVDFYKKKIKFYNGILKFRYYVFIILVIVLNVFKLIMNCDLKWLLGKYLRIEVLIFVFWLKN